MKIAYILGIFPRLYQTFILNDMINLIDKGNSVNVFSINKSQENKINEDVLRFKNKIFYFDDFIENKGFLTRHLTNISYIFKKYPPLYEAIGNMLFRSNEGEMKKYFWEFQWKFYALRKIADKLKNDKYDIIHGAFGDMEALAAMILSHMTGIPYSFETHAKDLYVNFKHAHEKIKNATLIATISHYNVKYLIDQCNCPSSKIVVKRISFNKRYCDKVLGKRKKENMIIAVCRLDPIKGLEYAIDAFKIIVLQRPDLRFVIIGDGPLKDKLMEKRKELALTDKINFLGNMSNEKTLNYIAESTIMLHPSVIAENGDRDGIPTSMIEAMYLKTPVISTKVSGIPELIDDGVNGMLTEPGNVLQIVEKMNLIISDRSLRIAMGERGREKVETEFNIDKGINKLLKSWDKII